MERRILLVNPIESKRKPKRGKRKMAKRRSAAQRAATRKLVAYNKRRRSGSTSKRRTTARKRRAIGYTVGSLKRYPIRRRKLNPIRRRRRKNPVKRGMLAQINKVLMPAIPAAGGALALDLLWGYAPIPDRFKTGYVGTAVKVAGALSIGYLAPMIPGVKKQTGEAMAVGALTVVLHGLMKELVAKNLPMVNLGEGFINAGYPAGYFDQNMMGEYVSEYVSAGATLPSGEQMGEYVSGWDSENAYANYYS